MTDQDRVTEALFSVVDSLNRRLAKDQRLAKSPETVLTGENSRLDSLGLVNFIVATEQMIEDQFQTTITLTDESVMSSINGPLRTIGSLARYISERLRG